jgi:predicted anti-sigma-YlaC factor YlaD
VDGELSGIEQRCIRDHLAHCQACSAEYEALLSMKSMISSLRVVNPRDDFETDILKTLQKERSKSIFTGSFWNWRGLLLSRRSAFLVSVTGASLSMLAAAFSIVLTLTAPAPSVTSPIAANVVHSSMSQVDYTPREYLYLHRPYTWDDETQPVNNGPVLTPAGDVTIQGPLSPFTVKH